jgi:predicted SAM-dependent methyltransferase
MKKLNLGCGYNFHPEWVNIDFQSTGKGVIAHNLLLGIPFPDNSFDVIYHSHVLEHFSESEGKKLINECFRVLKKGGIIRIAVPDLEKIVVEYLSLLKQNRENINNSSLEKYHWIKLELFDQVGRDNYGGEIKKYLSNPTLKIEKYIEDRVGNEFIKVRNNYLNSPLKKESFFHKIKRWIFGKNLDYWEIGKFRQSGEIHKCMYDSFIIENLLQSAGFKQFIVCKFNDSSIPNWSKYELDSKDGKVIKPDSLFVEAKK